MAGSTPKAVKRNDDDMAEVETIAASGADRPVLMLNLNRYSPSSGFPDAGLYRDYMIALARLLPEVGGRILWQSPAHGQIVGEQPIDEVLAIWYPSHAAFVAMPKAPGAVENYRLRAACVAYAVIHRCDGDHPPLA